MEKKKEEISSKEKYFNEILRDTRNQYLKEKDDVRNQTTLRQLTAIKVGLQLKRQTQDLSKYANDFQLQIRKESNIFFRLAASVVKSSWFSVCISSIIIINTIFLSLDQYPENQNLNSNISNSNYFFTLFFLFEMCLKMIAFGFRLYFKDPFNTFDSLVVLGSVIDLSIIFSSSSSSGGAVTALRALRLIRIFKLAKSWSKLQHLLKTIWKTLKDVSTFSILLFLFAFIYSLLGMELFGFKANFTPDGKIDMENGRPPNSNFNNFLQAFATVFIAFCNDGWNDIFYMYSRSVDSALSTIYFFSLIIIGQKILLNLFLAILLENFDEDSLEQEIDQNFKDQEKDIVKLTKIETIVKKFREWFIEFFNLEDDITIRKRNQSEKMKRKKDQIRSRKNQTVKIIPEQKTENQKSLAGVSESEEDPVSSFDDSLIVEGRSIFIFGEQNYFRSLLYKIVKSNKFDYFIILTIAVSGVQLALTNPLHDPNGQIEVILSYIDIGTTIIFALEVLLKILTFGFIMNGKSSYMRNLWNVLDFTIVFFSVANLTPLVNNVQILKIFRVSRPLRLISRNKGLKVAIKALAKAIPSIVNVSVITLLFFLIFGIILTSYFKGKIYVCNTDDLQGLSWSTSASRSPLYPLVQEGIANKWDCFNSGGTWSTKSHNFDNILESMIAVYTIANVGGWYFAMYSCMDATEIDWVMIPSNNIYWCLIFFFFIIVSTFMMLNLFVGVVISTFNREKDKIGGQNLLTDRQKEWIDTRLLIIQSKPIKSLKPPANKFRSICFRIQSHKAFDTFIMTCILLNTIVLTLKWFEQPEEVNLANDVLNYFFTAVFILEAVIKILALDKVYFRDSWNIFDFIIVIGSICSVVISFFTSFSLKGATTIVRAFRIARIIRIVKKAQRLRLIFNTFIVTLPALTNVGGLLLIILYIYSVLGVYLFATVMRNGSMSEVINFENFGNAFVTLFVVSTGDGWDSLVAPFLKSNSITYQCIESPTYEDYLDNGSKTIGCGSKTAGVFFFYSYFLIVKLIFLNLFIAIILQGFEDTQRKDSRLFNNDTLALFRDIWSKFDPEATSFIPISKLKDFLFKLGSPLGFDKSFEGNKVKQDKFIASLELPIYNNLSDFQFLDVLDSLSLRLLVQENFQKQEEEEKRKEKKQSQKITGDKSILRIQSQGSSDSLQKISKNRKYQQRGEGFLQADAMNQTQSFQKANKHSGENKQTDFRTQLQNEINKIKFNQDAQVIDAVQKVQQQEKKLEQSKRLMSQDYLTSQHLEVASVAVQKFKNLKKNRQT